MNDDKGNMVQWALAKVLGLWAFIGVTSWDQAASFVAFLVSMCVLSEWVYRFIVSALARWEKWKGRNSV